MASSIKDKISKSGDFVQLTSPILSPTKAKETEFIFRVLPYKWQNDNDPSIEVFTHNKIGKTEKQWALCPEKMFGEFCPYCDAGKKKREQLSKEDWVLVKDKYKVQKSVYLPGFVRKKYPEFYFLKISALQNFDKEFVGILTDKQLKKLFKLPEDLPYIDIWNLKTGIDLAVTVNPKTKEQNYITFTLKASYEQSVAGTTKEEMTLIKDSVKDMENLVESMVVAWGSSEKIIKLYNEQYGKPTTTSLTNSSTHTPKPTEVDETIDETDFDEPEEPLPPASGKETTASADNEDAEYAKFMADMGA